ncbi:DUF4332 domain-containing protein [Plectonema cf. radiosum LEGE 06105]|uniref:DUF4332 domain-containing protein n=1 Tax=Plectonema cf. radiosum LEGE 06105 TaxID=945769 RepID=A0A8J7FF72_9CYAN|nr:DUF4332 domain-containing protein [Plectonema radiosum]MBE9213176.1 DUF4332 domain-containing protein [Plectonema cf. radiosum LEGE 06105]
MFSKTKISGFKESNFPIEELPGLSQDEIDNLKNCNVTNTLALIEQGKNVEEKLMLAQKLQVHVQYVNKWVALADLARIPSVGTQYCGLLLHAGIASVMQLVTTPPHRLHKQVLRLQVATLQRRDLCPAIEQVQQWVEQAKLIHHVS